VDEVEIVFHDLRGKKKYADRLKKSDRQNIDQALVTLIQTIEQERIFPAKRTPLCQWCGFYKPCHKGSSAHQEAKSNNPNPNLTDSELENQTQAIQAEIPKHLAEILKQSQFDITLAAHGFSNPEIFRLLCQKSAEGVDVKLALLDSPENRIPKGFSTQQLTESGGSLFWIPVDDAEMKAQEPYCIIDRKTIITGNYQWNEPDSAQLSDVVVIANSPNFALQYLELFNNLLQRNGYPVQTISRIDSEAIIQRLELIRLKWFNHPGHFKRHSLYCL
jgi:hypothetical protein